MQLEHWTAFAHPEISSLLEWFLVYSLSHSHSLSLSVYVYVFSPYSAPSNVGQICQAAWRRPDESGQLHGARRLCSAPPHTLLSRLGRQDLLAASFLLALLCVRLSAAKGGCQTSQSCQLGLLTIGPVWDQAASLSTLALILMMGNSTENYHLCHIHNASKMRLYGVM